MTSSCTLSRRAILWLLLALPTASASAQGVAVPIDPAATNLAAGPGEFGVPPTNLEVPSEPERRPLVGGKNLFEILKQGGLLMIPLFLCSFVMTVFVFERAIALRRGRVIPAPFVKRFLQQLREGKLDRSQALDLCQSSQSPVADVFAGAVRKWGRPAVEIEQALIDAGERSAHGLRSYLRLFNVMSTVSPLLGLLGTTLGMIRLFNDISTSDAMGRTELLANGISEALLTTAGGLLLAIPSLCLYQFFVSRADRLLIDMDTLGQEIVDTISAEALADSRGGRTKGRTTAA